MRCRCFFIDVLMVLGDDGISCGICAGVVGIEVIIAR